MQRSEVSSHDDNPILDQAIAEFLRTEVAGQAVNQQQWFNDYPQCASGLAEFFRDRECLNQLILPIRVDSGVSSRGSESTNIFISPAPDLAGADTVDAVFTPPQLEDARYRPLRFHARGGMGEVWVAVDERLGREVALKKLRSGREGQRNRFLLEAQVTGQLEHPSIVPLHDVGSDGAGQPFYVMKFIQGRSLREAVMDYHAAKSSRDWPCDRAFLRLLETFLGVCNAIAYAHSKGVLHRDIKPDNVMIGQYGETLLLDWGLARVVGQPEASSVSSVRLSGDTSRETQDGAVIGSPFYMSPEGAKGATEQIDQQSDVYLLGATLYEMITGKPPRHGSSSWELIDLARKSQPTAPRKLDPRIPRTLEAICTKAMSYHKKDGYESSLALADDVQRYLAGEPTLAYREPWHTRAVRWIRKHRRGLTRGVAAIGVIALATLALGNARQARLLSQREAARQQLAAFYALADETEYYAANTDAVSERAPYYDPARAQDIGAAALELAATWGDRAEDLPLPPERTKLLATEYNLFLSMAHLHLEKGTEASRRTDGSREANTLLDRAVVLQTPTRGYYELRSRSLAALGDEPGAEAARQQAAKSTTPVTAQDYFLTGELHRLKDVNSSVSARDSNGDLRRVTIEQAIYSYRRALDQDPRHFWARFQLGRCLLAVGRNEESIESLGACIALRPDSPWAYTARGLVEGLSGRREVAVRDLDRAVALDAEFLPARLNRGVVRWLNSMNDNDPLETQAALVDFDAVLAAPPEVRLVEAAFYRAQIRLAQRDFSGALEDAAHVCDERATFAAAHRLRAKICFLMADERDGILAMQRFLATSGRLAVDPATPQAHLALGKSLRLLAMELVDDSRLRVLHRAAQELQAAATQPSSEAYQHLGAVQEQLGQNQDAVASYTEGLKLNDDPLLRNLRGWAYVSCSDFDSARQDFDAAIRLEPANGEAHAGLGYVYAMLGSVDKAREEAALALLNSAGNHLVLHNAACVYGRLSQTDEVRHLENENLALASLEQAMQSWRINQVGPDELDLIRRESAFPESLRSRPEFKQLTNPDDQTR